MLFILLGGVTKSREFVASSPSLAPFDYGPEGLEHVVMHCVSDYKIGGFDHGTHRNCPLPSYHVTVQTFSLKWS